MAEICAFQFLKKMDENRTKGWQDYLNICKVGGTQSFLQIVETGNLISPFEDGCIKSIITNLEENINIQLIKRVPKGTLFYIIFKYGNIL